MARLLLRTVATVIAAAALVTTAGCTAATTHATADDAWAERMQSLLSDPDGDGGASGTLAKDDGSKTASATVALGTLTAGRFDVLSVCRGGGVVHLQASRQTKKGDLDALAPLASATVVCGATTRLPVTIPGDNLVLTATGPAGTDWVAQVVSRGWEPDPGSVG